MRFASRLTSAAPTFLFMFVFLLFAPHLRAQGHVVDSKDLQGDLARSSQARQSNLDKLDRFFSAPAARQPLKSAHIGTKQVHNAIRQLGDDEVADFAARAERAQARFTAGALSNQEITYIIIALVTAVVILIIVAA